MNYYENNFPDVDDIVMTKVIKVDDSGAECILLEYNDRSSYLPINEFSKRRIKSARQVIRLNDILPLQVIYVDEFKNLIDVSKKHVTSADVELCNSKYKTMKKVYNIIHRPCEILSKKNNKDKDFYLKYIQNELIWPLCEKSIDPYIYFENIVYGEKEFDKKIDPMVVEVLLNTLKNRIKIKEIKIVSDIIVTNYGPEGVDAVKKCLMAGIIDNVIITVKNSPVYELTVTCFSKKEGNELLKKSLKLIEEQCSIEGSYFELKNN